MRHRILLAVGLLLVPGRVAAAQDAAPAPLRDDPGQRSFGAACSSCPYHGAGKIPFGTRGPTADESPEELAQVMLVGKARELDGAGMPAFGPSLTDPDVTRPVVRLRSTAKPDAPQSDVADSVAVMRANSQRKD